MKTRAMLKVGALALMLIASVWTIRYFTPASVLKRNLYGMSAVPSFSGVHERRRGSADYIQSLGPDVVPLLIPYLQHSDSELRRNAARALIFFPERRNESIQALLDGLASTESDDLITLEVVGGALKELLDQNEILPSPLADWLNSKDTYRRMVAMEIALHQDPKDATARSALLEFLKPISEIRKTAISTSEMQAAYVAVRVLGEMNFDDRSFAWDEMKRITSISEEYCRSFSAVGRLREQIVELIRTPDKAEVD